MKIVQLHIENFLAIGTASLRLDDRGLVLIQGLNDDDTSADSNGAGKSSIADALCWALYGTTARGEEGDGVVNRTAGKGCRVGVLIEDGTELTWVYRHRKHKTGKNSLQVLSVPPGGAGEMVDLTKGTDKLTQAVVTGLVGSSYDVFRASIYAGQENFPDLPSMTDKQLKVLVEEAAGVTVLERAYEDARSRAAEVKGRHDRAKGEIDRRAGRRADLVEQHARTEARIEGHELDRKSQADAKVAAAKGSAAEATRIKGELAKLDEAAARDGIASCDAAIAAVEGERVEERRLVAAVGDADRKVATLRAELGALKRTHDAQQADIERLEHDVGCPCEGCGRPITETEIAPAKASRTEAKGKTLATFRATKVEAEKAIAAHKASADALSTFQASMTDVSQKGRQRASHEAELTRIEALKRDLLRHAGDAKRAVEEAKAIAGRPNPFTEDLNRLEREIAALDADAATAEERFREIAKELRVADLAVGVFSPAGVRAHILDTVTPFLNDKTAKYLSILSDDNIQATWATLVPTAKGELREKFSIEITSRSGGERFRAVSGGEKRKVRIAAALALQDLVSSRATKPIDLFVGDEIDDALDNAGLERLMTILEDKARERGSVFVVSHRSLRDWIPQVLTVVKKGGQAEIIEELV